jgi:hypothetical protein
MPAVATSGQTDGQIKMSKFLGTYLQSFLAKVSERENIDVAKPLNLSS